MQARAPRSRGRASCQLASARCLNGSTARTPEVPIPLCLGLKRFSRRLLSGCEPRRCICAALWSRLQPDHAEALRLLEPTPHCEARRLVQIDEAERCLRLSAQQRQPGSFQLESAIHSAHCNNAFTVQTPRSAIAKLHGPEDAEAALQRALALDRRPARASSLAGYCTNHTREVTPRDLTGGFARRACAGSCVGRQHPAASRARQPPSR